MEHGVNEHQVSTSITSIWSLFNDHLSIVILVSYHSLASNFATHQVVTTQTSFRLAKLCCLPNPLISIIPLLSHSSPPGASIPVCAMTGEGTNDFFLSRANVGITVEGATKDAWHVHC